MKLTLRLFCIFIFLVVLSWAKPKHKKPHTKIKHKSKSRSDAIVGENEVFETFVHDAEFVVGLVRLFEQYNQYLCAGTIVNKNWVFTSNTCGLVPTVHEMLLGLVVVRGGTKWIEGFGGYDHRILDIYYVKEMAFINVKDPFDHEPYEIPIPQIASALFLYNDSKPAQIFGWGESIAQGSTSGTLQTIPLKLISNTECNSYFPYVDENTKDLFCAMSTQRPVCSGDGGAPLIYQDVLIGIALKAGTLCEISKPTVFATLGEYTWEIIQTLGWDVALRLKFYPLPTY